MATVTVIDQLAALDAEALARVWCDLNWWQWPADLNADSKPPWWDGSCFTEGRILSDRKMGINWVVMRYIEAHVADEAIQSAWRKKMKLAKKEL